MDGRALQRRASERAKQLPGSYLDHPFGDEWDVRKVRGKVFMLQTELDGEPVITVKAHPDDALALRSTHASIAVGYHMNKRHWITVHPGDDIDGALVDDLVTEAYLLVLEKNVPKSQWLVDPAAFVDRAGVGTAHAWLALQSAYAFAAERAAGLPAVRRLDPVA